MDSVSKPFRMNDEELTAAETLTSLYRSLSSSIPPAPRRPLPPVVRVPILVMPTEYVLIPPAVPRDQQNIMHLVSTTHPSLHKQPNIKRTKNDKARKKFPQKLLEILETPEHSAILKWLPGGKAFVIMDRKRFTSDILPKYLKQAKFTSFTRKLFRWKFVTVPHGPFMGVYYHELFRRDRPALCKLMSCSKIVVPRLAIIAQASQHVMDSVSTPPKFNTMDLCVPKHDASLQVSKEASKRVLMSEKQLLSFCLKTAHRYGQEKNGISRHAKANPQAVTPVPQPASTRQYSALPEQHPYTAPAQQIHDIQRYPQFHMMNDNTPSSRSRILRDAYRVQKIGITMEYNAHKSRLAKLRQTGMLDRTAVTGPWDTI
eukprot:scaffold986_cov289-Chaetoceros_neogracile.AAC.1